MANDPHRATVGDYVTLVRGTTYKGALVGHPGPALLGLGSIEPGGGFRIGNYQTYGGECPAELMLFPGDIYASLKGATKDGKMIGSVARVPPSVSSGRLTQDTVKLVFRTRNAEDATYLYWILRTPQYRDYCAGHAMGSAVVALSRRDFLLYSVPPLTAQRRTVITLLNLIEEKLELNRQINGTLEAMARAIFGSAQANGRWADLPLGSIADIFDGPHATPKLTSTGPIFLGISNLEQGLLNLANTNRLSDEDFVKWTRRIEPHVGDVVFSYETRLGEAALVPNGIKCCLGRRMGLLRTKHVDISPILLLMAYLAPPFQDLLRQRTIHGSTVDRIPLKDMASFPIALPLGDEARALNKVLSPMRQKVEANQREAQVLSELRDLLLPKLMSGEAQVLDAEKIVSRAA